MHSRVRIHNQFEGEIRSKDIFEVHYGFRKVQLPMILSEPHSRTEKVKYVKKLSSDKDRQQWFMASFFSEAYFPPANFLAFTRSTNEMEIEDGRKKDDYLCLVGSLLYPDLFKIILKRIILTGYPMKGKKKKAIVKNMFFNPDDIKFFIKNGIYTKNGLRGQIKKSIGTHGKMKCIFSGNISYSDTVCMNLYKRVFPSPPPQINLLP